MARGVGPVAATFSPAEAEFDSILRGNRFMTASLKGAVQAPSIEDGRGLFVILPDILAIDADGGQGWCFEVKDETTSSYKMRRLDMTLGYSGPVWFLEYRKAIGYVWFSSAFNCPCVIAIKGTSGWKAGFFTMKVGGKVDYNRQTVAVGWSDPEGIPVLFDELQDLEPFLKSLRTQQASYWQ